VSSSPLLIESVLLLLSPHKKAKVLDAACGFGKWGFLIKIHYDVEVIGIDLSINNLAKRNYDELIMADVRYLPFKDLAMDYSLACEIIEHLSKEGGIKMIKELERVTKKKILLTTPYASWYYEKPKVNGHITKWKPKEFKEMGFKVRGIGSKFSFKGKLMFVVKHFILKPLAYIVPEIGEFLIAIKKFDDI